MSISPAVFTPIALGENSRPNFTPLSKSKAEVMREKNLQPAILHLLPGVDLSGLSQRMIKMSARLGEFDCRILNLRKLTPDDPTETRFSLQKRRYNILQLMQVMETTTGVSMFFTTEA